MKSGNLNFLEPSGLLQTCNGTALPLSKLLVVTDVSVENTADIFRVTQFKFYCTVAIIMTGLSVLSIDGQASILGESGAARI